MKLSIWLRPDQKLWKEVSGIIKHVSKEYHTYYNLNEWKGPHITLIFLKFRAQKLQQVVRELSDICSKTKPFNIKLHGIGYFMKMSTVLGRRNYVLYLKPRENAELRRLYYGVERGLRPYKDLNHPFKPHMTLAHVDLSKDNFYRALKEFKDLKFNRIFTVREIFMSTRINGKRKVIKIKLGS